MAAEAPKRRWISQEVREGLAVARTLRDELGLRDDEPVPCMVEVAEARLAVDVVLVPLRDAVSGFYLPVRPHPVVVVSDHHPVSRQRFTLAHEIAHHALGHGASPRIQESPGEFDGQSSATAPSHSPALPDGAAAVNHSPGVPDSAAAVSQSPALPDSATASSRSPDSAGAGVAGTGTGVPKSHYTPQRSVDPNERAANAFAGELLIPDDGSHTVASRWFGESPLDQVVRLSSHFGVSAFAASVKLQLLGVLDAAATDGVREQFRTLEHVDRYDALGLPALDDELQRHRDAGGGVRCAPRARTVVRRLLGELDAA